VFNIQKLQVQLTSQQVISNVKELLISTEKKAEIAFSVRLGMTSLSDF